MTISSSLPDGKYSLAGMIVEIVSQRGKPQMLRIAENSYPISNIKKNEDGWVISYKLPSRKNPGKEITSGTLEPYRQSDC